MSVALFIGNHQQQCSSVVVKKNCMHLQRFLRSTSVLDTALNVHIIVLQVFTTYITYLLFAHHFVWFSCSVSHAILRIKNKSLPRSPWSLEGFRCMLDLHSFLVVPWVGRWTAWLRTQWKRGQIRGNSTVVFFTFRHMWHI